MSSFLFLGSVYGANGGSRAAREISEYLTEWLFDLPPTVALEKAYQLFGVKKNASMKEIKSKFRERAKKLHPDVPGGSHEEFLKLEIAIELIKTARKGNGISSKSNSSYQ